MKPAVLFFGLFLILTSPLSSQHTTIQSNEDFLSFGINMQPGVFINLDSSSDFHTLGLGVSFSGQFSLPFLPPLHLVLGTGYLLNRIKAESSMSTLFGDGGLSLRLHFFPEFAAGAWAKGGYTFNVVNTDSSVLGGTPYFAGGLYFGIFPWDRFSINLEAGYMQLFGVEKGITITVGTTYHMNAKRVKAIRDPGILFDPVFPLLFKVYEDLPVGTVSFVNTESEPITDVRITMRIGKYMDDARECAVLDTISTGGHADIDLLARFEGLSLDFPEEQKAKANIEITYKYRALRYRQDFEGEVVIHPNETIRWTDIRRASIFLTPEDRGLRDLAESASKAVIPEVCNEINTDYAVAMGLFQTLQRLGIQYAKDSDTPFFEYSADPDLIDTVRFPSDVLKVGKGDSMELAVLYSSLLEAAGIPSALFYLGGTMAAALRLNFDDETPMEDFFAADRLIHHGETYWLPVALTDMDRTFTEAVTVGSELWAASQAPELLVHAESREKFRPLEYPDSGFTVYLPPDLGEVYKSEERKLIDTIIAEDVAALQASLQERSSITTTNSLGVLFAKYEKYTDAVREFSKATLTQDYVPALVNLGNIYYFQDDLERAQPFFQRAYDQTPFDSRVILALAKVNHKMENYGSARKMYEQLRTLDPELAEKFAYLNLTGEDAIQAAREMKIRDEVVWIEE